MSDADSRLGDDERILYVGRVSIWSLAPLLLAGLVLIAYGIGLAFWIAAALRYFTTELVVTNQRVVATFGLIRRNQEELSILRASSIRVDQTALGRFFGFGSIVVAGDGSPLASVPGIRRPLEFRRRFLEILDEADSAHAGSLTATDLALLVPG